MPNPHTLTCAQELSFGPYGGAELFFADIDGDGQLEILAYQGPGVFGAGMYREWPHVAAAYPESTCVSAFKRDGRRLWTFGEPNPPDKPFISHAHESCVAVGDVDGDGIAEIAIADGDTIHLLDGPTGTVRATAALPGDNFFIVQVLGAPTASNEAAVLVKNGEGGYDDWRYGEPCIGLNAALDFAWAPTAIPGAGHHILVLDTDADGAPEYLVGYCALKPSGQWRCIVDAITADSIDPDHDHVDYTDILDLNDGTAVLGFAGSSRAYLVTRNGRTLFSRPDRHVQGCVLGRFRSDSLYQMAVYNDDGPLVLYDPRGTELWRVSTGDKEYWPLGMPQTCAGHRFHRNRPVVRFTTDGADTILFTDGGWPWAMDGNGAVSVRFEPPESSRQPESAIPDQARGDDMGYGFATKVLDWNGDGKLAAVIYDRQHLWVFPANPSFA